MRQMIPTFDIDLKKPSNAALFEKNTREASERLQLLSSTPTSQKERTDETCPSKK
jgi:hypothetical protein